jgi:hypothetical protein
MPVKLSDVTDPRTTSDPLAKRHAKGRRFFWGLVVASVAAIIAPAWLLTNPVRNQDATLVAFLVTVLAAIIVLAIGIDTLRDATGQIALGVGVVLLVGAVTVLASLSGLFVNQKSYGVQKSWTSVVHREMAAHPTGPGVCTSIPSGRVVLAKFGDVDQVCIYGSRDSTTIDFQRTTNGGTTGLEYSSSGFGGYVQDACLARIGGNWWRFNSLGDNDTGCPPGSHFVGGA